MPGRLDPATTNDNRGRGEPEFEARSAHRKCPHSHRAQPSLVAAEHARSSSPTTNMRWNVATGSTASHGFIFPNLVIFVGVSPQRNSGAGSSLVAIGKPETVELAIKRRAPDPQPPRDLRHLAAIMGEREPDRLRLDLLQRAHVTAVIEQIQQRTGAPVVTAGIRGCAAADAVVEQERRLDRGRSGESPRRTAARCVPTSWAAATSARRSPVEPSPTAADLGRDLGKFRTGRFPLRPRARRRGKWRSRAAAHCRASDRRQACRSVSADIERMRLPSSAAKRTRKWRVSSGMSSARSRSGGTVIGKTCRR